MPKSTQVPQNPYSPGDTFYRIRVYIKTDISNQLTTLSCPFFHTLPIHHSRALVIVFLSLLTEKVVLNSVHLQLVPLPPFHINSSGQHDPRMIIGKVALGVEGTGTKADKIIDYKYKYEYE
ncbi:hypothetical protein K435DRAFT_971712 [Dendrothele bispora CBS 962.96]|uniref:Uncharacterized protein n=1 Tax=Dendrothele bispora (strain CBS 962.96) TaxID=1314807 RepID=A0A4S8L3I7_DENBC|nr:hypothetical protein K435DRAFT_971712 [Dendrothele bispora CBS 962.96]